MNFIEELEPRVLLSVTAAQLAADNSAIIAAKATYNSNIAALESQLVSGSQTIASDFLASAPVNAADKKAVADLKKVLAGLKKETTALGKDSVSLSAKAVKAGDVEISKPSTKAAAKVQKAGLLLVNKTVADRNAISGDTTLATFYAALNALVAGTPSNTAAAADVANLETAVTPNLVVNAETPLTSAVLTLTVDLGITHFV